MPVVPFMLPVRKHRAPKGALRQRKRLPNRFIDEDVRKHRAPKGALRLPRVGERLHDGEVSESTERQKVH